MYTANVICIPCMCYPPSPSHPSQNYAEPHELGTPRPKYWISDADCGNEDLNGLAFFEIGRAQAARPHLFHGTNICSMEQIAENTQKPTKTHNFVHTHGGTWSAGVAAGDPPTPETKTSKLLNVTTSGPDGVPFFSRGGHIGRARAVAVG